jgi:hypothetical protein
MRSLRCNGYGGSNNTSAALPSQLLCKGLYNINFYITCPRAGPPSRGYACARSQPFAAKDAPTALAPLPKPCGRTASLSADWMTVSTCVEHASHCYAGGHDILLQTCPHNSAKALPSPCAKIASYSAGRMTVFTTRVTLLHREQSPSPSYTKHLTGILRYLHCVAQYMLQYAATAQPPPLKPCSRPVPGWHRCLLVG